MIIRTTVIQLNPAVKDVKGPTVLSTIGRFSLLPIQKSIEITTDGTLIRAEEGPKVLASPPTAYIVQANF